MKKEKPYKDGSKTLLEKQMSRYPAEECDYRIRTHEITSLLYVVCCLARQISPGLEEHSVSAVAFLFQDGSLLGKI